MYTSMYTLLCHCCVHWYTYNLNQGCNVCAGLHGDKIYGAVEGNIYDCTRTILMYLIHKRDMDTSIIRTFGSPSIQGSLASVLTTCNELQLLGLNDFCNSRQTQARQRNSIACWNTVHLQRKYVHANRYIQIYLGTHRGTLRYTLKRIWMDTLNDNRQTHFEISWSVSMAVSDLSPDQWLSMYLREPVWPDPLCVLLVQYRLRQLERQSRPWGKMTSKHVHKQPHCSGKCFDKLKKASLEQQRKKRW